MKEDKICFNEDGCQIFVLAAGLIRQDFNVKLENNKDLFGNIFQGSLIRISYEERKGTNFKELFPEGRYYSKSWELPFAPRLDDVSAIYLSGILTVTIKKPKQKIPTSYQINVN